MAVDLGAAAEDRASLCAVRRRPAAAISNKTSAFLAQN